MNDISAESDFSIRDEKKKQLFLNQKQTLDTFLEHGAITRAQYNKSLGDLIEKMGMSDEAGI